MSNLSKCSIDSHAPAAAQCPQCKKPFSKKYLTEYEDELICLSCLEKLLEQAPKKESKFPSSTLLTPVFVSIGLTVLYFLCYLFGTWLIKLPDNFH